MRYLLAAIIILSFSLHAHAATLSLIRPDGDVSEGDTFTLDIFIDPDIDRVYGAQFDLSFNNQFLEGIKLEQGPFISGTMIVNAVENDKGEMTYAETRTGNVKGTVSKGIMARAKFRAVNSGITTIEIKNIKLVNDEDQIIQNVSSSNMNMTIQEAKEAGQSAIFYLLLFVLIILSSVMKERVEKK